MIAPQPLTDAQLAAALDHPGTAPCPGVQITTRVPLGVATPDGPALHVSIFRPALRAAAPVPALLIFHGGGYTEGAPEDCGEVGKYLAATLGIVTVAASYRLASPTRATFPAILTDARHAWRWLQTHASELGVAPSRVAVAGRSAGVLLAGHLAVASRFTDYAEGEARPAALIAEWGPIDFVARWFDRGESAGAEGALLGASYETNPALYHQSSVLAHASGALPPALFIYGRQDSVVHARQGRLGLAAWRAAGAHAELSVLPNIGHGVVGDNRPQRHESLRLIAGFLAARLG